MLLSLSMRLFSLLLFLFTTTYYGVSFKFPNIRSNKCHRYYHYSCCPCLFYGGILSTTTRFSVSLLSSLSVDNGNKNCAASSKFVSKILREESENESTLAVVIIDNDNNDDNDDDEDKEEVEVEEECDNENNNNDYVWIWENNEYRYEYNTNIYHDFDDGNEETNIGNNKSSLLDKVSRDSSGSNNKNWRRFLKPNKNCYIEEDVGLDSNDGLIGVSDNKNIDSINTNVNVNDITKRTINWCNEFVIKLDLCPWAKASLQTKGALRFFLVPPYLPPRVTTQSNTHLQMQLEEQEENRNRRIVQDVARRFQNEILHHNGNNNRGNEKNNDDNSIKNSNPSADMLERAAIYFVIFTPNNIINDNYNGNNYTTTTTSTSIMSSFLSFYDWFNNVEDDWSDELDDVIIAPFHPNWQFEFDTLEEYALNYEKRSPYPLISLVSTNVVEKAGGAVTEFIGENNRDILLSIEQEEKEGEEKEQQQCEHSNINNDKGNIAKLWRSAINS